MKDCIKNSLTVMFFTINFLFNIIILGTTIYATLSQIIDFPLNLIICEMGAVIGSILGMRYYYKFKKHIL